MYRKITWLSGLGVLALVLVACEQPQKRGDSAGMTEEPAKAERSATAYEAAWNQLRQGMKHTEVLALLGEPPSVKVTKINTYWYYSERGAKGPHVVFDTRTMTVDGWRRPDAG